jgi:hypothetical protein
MLDQPTEFSLQRTYMLIAENLMTNQGMKKKLITVYILLLLPLSGCGIISIGYNYSDVYLRYTINSYADFNTTQKDFIRKQVDDYMHWHRINMLPAYIAFLQELQHTVQSGMVLKKEDVSRYRQSLRTLYVKTLQPFVYPATNLLSGLEPRQIDELVQSLAKENNKQRDKDLSGNKEDQLRIRAEKIIDFIENQVGNLSEEQLQHIRDESRKLPFATSLYMQMREDNQAKLIELLRQNNNKEELTNYLSLWLLMPEKFRSPAEQAFLHEYELASDDFMAGVYNGLSERQKSNLLSNIEKYITNFQSLSLQ